MEKNLSKVDVVVISGTNHYEERNKKVIEEYKKQGKTVCYLTSDFHHIKKCQYKFEQEDTVQIHVLPYHKNISVLRLLSHFMFSCKAYRYLKKLKPEIVYTEIPRSSLLTFLSSGIYVATSPKKIAGLPTFNAVSSLLFKIF